MLKHLLVAAGILAAATLPSLAAEITGDATFPWRAVGTTTNIGSANHPYFVGSFAGVIVSADAGNALNHAGITCPGYNDIGVGAGGYCITTDKDGDTYITKWSCTAIPPIPGTLAACDGTGTFSGGTGKFAKASGGDRFKAYTVGILPDGTAVGYSAFTDSKLTY
jgi:hypothetical protein